MFSGVFFDHPANFTLTDPRFAYGDCSVPAFSCYINNSEYVGVAGRGVNRYGDVVVTVQPVFVRCHIQVDEISTSQELVGGDAVGNDLVQRSAH